MNYSTRTFSILSAVLCIVFTLSASNLAAEPLTLNTGQYLITKIEETSKTVPPQTFESNTEEDQDFKHSLYFQFNKEKTELTFFKMKKGVKKKLTQKDSGLFATNLFDKKATLKVQTATSFALTVQGEKEASYKSFTLTCEYVSMNDPKFLAVKAAQQAKFEKEVAYLNKKKKKLIQYDLTTNKGITRSVDNVNIVIPFSSNLENRSYTRAFLNFDGLRINSKDNSCGIYAVDEFAIIIGTKQEKEEAFSLDRCLKQNTRYPEDIFFQEKNGAIYFDKKKQSTVALYHTYNKNTELHTIALSTVWKFNDLDKLARRYAQMRTLSPENRLDNSMKKAIKKIIEMPEDAFYAKYGTGGWKKNIKQEVLKELKYNLEVKKILNDSMIGGSISPKHAVTITLKVFRDSNRPLQDWITKEHWNILYANDRSLLCQSTSNLNGFEVVFIQHDGELQYLFTINDSLTYNLETAIRTYRVLNSLNMKNFHSYSKEFIDNYFRKFMMTFSVDELPDYIRVTTKKWENGIFKTDGTEIVPAKYIDVDVDNNKKPTGFIAVSKEKKLHYSLDGKKITEIQ